MRRIVCFGPGPMFKGGIANYNTSLAKTLDKISECEVYIVSWTQQYPAIIPRDFIDRSSYSDQLEGTNIKVKYITNYNNPFSWIKTCKYIKSLNPEKIIFQWSLAIQGPPMGYIASWLRKNTASEIVFDLHFVAQKEVSALDRKLLRIGIKNADTYIVHSKQTSKELIEFFPNRKFEVVEGCQKTNGTGIKIIQLYHPVYDMFEYHSDFNVDAFKESLNLKKHVFLFFGFIRKYKGLHNLIESFAKLSERRDDVSLLIVGESFWHTLDKKKLSTKIKNGIFSFAKSLFLKKTDDEREYRPLDLIKKFGIEDKTAVVNTFVANEDVHKYFQSSDSLVLFYDKASPSGVGSIAYNFKMPLLVSEIEHLEEMVEDGFNGYVANPKDIEDMVNVLEKSIEQPINKDNVQIVKDRLSWENYANSILIE
ncbi:MAG: glycosyltransferase [Hyphomicrobiales bacterium]